MDFIFSVLTLNGHSCGFVVSRLLDLHLRQELQEFGAAELREEVQQVVAAGKHERLNVEVLAHEVWIFRLYWRDLSVQLIVVV